MRKDYALPTEQFSLLQVHMLVAILDVGDAVSRQHASFGKRWDGCVAWRPRDWFVGERKQVISRALLRLDERGYLERLDGQRRPKPLGRGWNEQTRYVRLTPEGHRVARDAKFGRIAPMRTTRDGR